MTTHPTPFPRSQVWRRHQAGVVCGLVLLATLALVLTTSIRSPLKDDVAWLLYVARKWLGGQRLYEDLVEVNPPLIVWIYAIPAAIADWTGAAPRVIATLFFALMVLGSAAWTAVLLRGRAAVFARPLPVACLLASAMLLLPGVEFGQREHLLLLAVLPYLVMLARTLDGEAEPRGVAVAVGVVCGLGCALKPSFALALLLLEAVALFSRQRQSWRGMVRPAALAAFVTMALYGAGVLLFCPAFLQKAVPLALALYGGTDTPWWQLLIDSRRLLAGEAVLLLLCWSRRSALALRTPFLRHLLVALLLFAAGATVVFVLQGKNWFYHRLPATLATVLALLLWIAAVWPDLRTRRWTVAVPLGLALAALGLFAEADFARIKPWVALAVAPEQSTEMRLERLIKQQHAKRYIAFSEWIGLGFPVVDNAGVSWASRFDSMWALKGELWRARQDGAAPHEFPIRRWVARDFIAGCPDLAVVDSRGGINYVAVLVASEPEFAALWSRYREIAAFDGLRVFQRGSADCAPSVPAAAQPTLSAAEPDSAPMLR